MDFRERQATEDTRLGSRYYEELTGGKSVTSLTFMNLTGAGIDEEEDGVWKMMVKDVESDELRVFGGGGQSTAWQAVLQGWSQVVQS